jgi:hypothetical protein
VLCWQFSSYLALSFPSTPFRKQRTALQLNGTSEHCRPCFRKINVDIFVRNVKTNSMLEANSLSASKKLVALYGTRKFLVMLTKPTLIPFRNQSNPFQMLTPVFKVHFNIISTTLRFLKRSHILIFPNYNFPCISFRSCTCYISSPFCLDFSYTDNSY